MSGAPDWIETAHKLTAHPDCPEGLQQYTVSEAVFGKCSRCGCTRVFMGGCERCHRDTMPVVTPAVTVPALDDSAAGLANVGPLYMALLNGSEHVIMRYVPLARDEHHVQIRGDHYRGSGYAAEALVIAWLAERSAAEDRARLAAS